MSQILMDDSGPPSSVEVITLTQGRPGLANPHKREVQVLIFMCPALQQGILTLVRSRLATGRRQCRGMLFRIAQPTEREREREGERRSRGMRLRLTRELSLSTENQNDRAVIGFVHFKENFSNWRNSDGQTTLLKRMFCES